MLIELDENQIIMLQSLVAHHIACIQDAKVYSEWNNILNKLGGE
jgi:hypothetical protein